jgi:phosphoribosylamine--glycine ligase
MYLESHALPVVLKADGLAAGKGVLICETHQEAIHEFQAILRDGKFGKSGGKVVVEQFLEGIELSVFVLCNGPDYVILPEAKDYKRIGEGDKGLNTGGMGAVSPVPFAGTAFMEKVEQKIIRPTVYGLVSEGIRYTGFIFIGLMKVGDEPFVIEYNCRMGDPETEVVFPRITSDVVELFKACADGTLKSYSLTVDQRAAAAVMVVSGGYPESYEKGKAITGVDDVEDSLLFHAGTKAEGDKLVTSGGRVLAVTSFADDVTQAAALSVKRAAAIRFEHAYYRKDIGYEF